ncbi:kinase/pyrophosphorylase [Olsenella porci]|jgi:regulator of PEP synthase PpsR (kinase-PPPase family)|uniref:Kinase/pyrophosphorylase n=1 Tax=Olsenella porci TaxID=2652279 RepID=A0A6N7XQH1_9ACTN|nr:kinase/pyrophosphorylase [Olsenella porci]MCI1998429.1 kinase/pyrophosphorylase [Olsenella sp.]MST73224.1 kinase/pyrophosphorylase [Olsenella porci]
MPEDSLDDDVMDNVTPVVFVLSDARGKTAAGVVEAAADQFGEDAVIIKQLGNVRSVDMVKDYLDRNLDPGVPVAVFHTLVDRNLRRDIRRELDKRGIPSIDLLGPAITVLSTLTDQEPIYQPGHRTDTEVQEVQ